MWDTFPAPNHAGCKTGPLRTPTAVKQPLRVQIAFILHPEVSPVQFPLGFVFEGNLLQASIVTEEAMVSTTGQKTETYDFSDPEEFNTQWE